MANPGVGYVFSKTPIHREDTFTLDIRAEDVYDMAAWQFDIAFDPAILEAIDVSEGDFLKRGSTTLFQSGTIDNSRQNHWTQRYTTVHPRGQWYRHLTSGDVQSEIRR